MMKWFKRFILVVLLVLANVAMASEHGEGSVEKKEKPPSKPPPYSAVSVILQLPEVQNWRTHIEQKKDGAIFSIWGDAIITIGGNGCWGVVVGKTKGEKTAILEHFCIMQGNHEIWVESKQKDLKGDAVFMPYEIWQKSCKPTDSSTGSC